MRIAGLTEEPFDIPDGAEGRTDTGQVWVRWANVGSYEGWYAVGTREPKPATDFWSKVFALATIVGNGNVDAVHSVGSAILSLGGLGVTASSGFAQGLLGQCLESQPARWLECMAPALYESDVIVAKDEGAPAGWRFYGGRVRGIADVVETITDKRIARLWVECCGHMLRDDRFDQAQVRFLARVGPGLLGHMSGPLKFGAVRDTWSWSQEQQAVWAVALVLALADTELATKVMLSATFTGDDWSREHPQASGPAEATLLSLMAATPYVPEYFAMRLRRTLVALPTHFEVLREKV